MEIDLLLNIHIKDRFIPYSWLNFRFTWLPALYIISIHTSYKEKQPKYSSVWYKSSLKGNSPFVLTQKETYFSKDCNNYKQKGEQTVKGECARSAGLTEVKLENIHGWFSSGWANHKKCQRNAIFHRLQTVLHGREGKTSVTFWLENVLAVIIVCGNTRECKTSSMHFCVNSLP